MKSSPMKFWKLYAGAAVSIATIGAASYYAQDRRPLPEIGVVGTMTEITQHSDHEISIRFAVTPGKDQSSRIEELKSHFGENLVLVAR